MDASIYIMTTDNNSNNPATDTKAFSSEIRKRSVVIAGHRTSVSLENIFWDTIRKIADEKGLSVNQIVTGIDAERSGNLSSAIRTYVLLALLPR